jgi:hypothetical protein
MRAYYYKADNGDGSGWIGFAMAEDKEGLFWAIDEFIDPYSVKIKRAHTAGYCFEVNGDESNYELSSYQPMINEDGWRKPNWKGLFEKS